ncbi:MurR/RpiR family transcriptional regulator [Salimicrobium flavidum]|uniref:Transcriptional regulator, RpiR family n=1 Tax=Salimicrobium flavidum TaxID=570947 RepID=A0A1N7KXW0_9BACI|nr:MurR/RpiR family transcriptional regulator [Salimicrobium flavidum]SIS66472.1 transcriptional regulator, RpiR family [Salimicrobium flavidum]
MKSTFDQLIRNWHPSLSKGQQKVADYLMKHQEKSAFLTASELGKEAGTSETTVIRVSYVLGFRGYSDMQHTIREDWLKDGQTDNEEEPDVFLRVVKEEQEIYERLPSQLDMKDVQKAVDALRAADNVYIGSHGSSYAAGYWLYYSLRRWKERVSLSQPSGVLVEDLNEITKDSLFILFSFPRYRKEGKDLLSLARKFGATVLVITNRRFSPLGREADILLTTEEGRTTDYHSIAPAMTISEMLIQGLAEQKGTDASDKKQQRLETLFAHQNIHLE